MKDVKRAYRYVRTKLRSWEEGMYIDRWTIVHACSGVTLGALAALFSIHFFVTLFSVLLIAVLWEGWELNKDIKETFENRCVDVGIAVVASIIVYWCIMLAFESRFVRILITMASILWTGYLAQQGWSAWFKKQA